ncbi:hypothetical protein PG991_000769 [Apiospora marii]|uniref:Uncharacterized protein n=1 Tax=Apiospora marii TaxID=335849 RepID=A0ABR1SSX8_9PEZI
MDGTPGSDKPLSALEIRPDEGMGQGKPEGGRQEHAPGTGRPNFEVCGGILHPKEYAFVIMHGTSLGHV